MRFNAAKSFNSMLKYAQQYTVNIYMEKGILWIHWMLEIMREDSKQRIAQEKKKKRAVKNKTKQKNSQIYFGEASFPVQKLHNIFWAVNILT